MRVLEGSFANLRGVSESNMEADLMQENSAKVMKTLIKQLRANKTMSVIKRTIAASDTMMLKNSFNQGNQAPRTRYL